MRFKWGSCREKMFWLQIDVLPSCRSHKNTHTYGCKHWGGNEQLSETPPALNAKAKRVHQGAARLENEWSQWLTSLYCSSLWLTQLANWQSVGSLRFALCAPEMAGNHVPSCRARLNGLSFSELKQFAWSDLYAAHTFQPWDSVVWIVLLAVLAGSCSCAIGLAPIFGGNLLNCWSGLMLLSLSSAVCHEMKQRVSNSGSLAIVAIIAQSVQSLFYFFYQSLCGQISLRLCVEKWISHFWGGIHFIISSVRPCWDVKLGK